MKAIITVDMDNEAFSQEANTGRELARIISELAERVDGYQLFLMKDTGDRVILRDINGNRVGFFEIQQ